MTDITTLTLTTPSLTSDNYHLWIRKIKCIAKQANVWEYVDPEGLIQAPTKPEYPRLSDFPLYLSDPSTSTDISTASAPVCQTYNQLTTGQSMFFLLQISVFRALFNKAEVVNAGIQVVRTAVFESACLT